MLPLTLWTSSALLTRVAYPTSRSGNGFGFEGSGALALPLQRLTGLQELWLG
jgi:hypothetical protein